MIVVWFDEDLQEPPTHIYSLKWNHLGSNKEQWCFFIARDVESRVSVVEFHSAEKPP